MRFVPLLGLLLCLPALAQTTVAGPTPGSFRVTESGAAEYRIPLRVPPGIAGMEPKLALAYNSQSGNGLLGVGWNLEGLSSITRCPRTMAQDGARGGVNYDANDRFCLDGQRLMAINGGSYGADGTEYRTERESFSKIVSFGQAGSGPAWFEVRTKSGQTLEYGRTENSRIEAQGKTTAAVWAVSRISDAKGNDLSVSYAEDGGNGAFHPQRIDYGGNAAAGVAPQKSLQFSHQPRSDVTPAYLAGSVARLSSRLTHVRTYSAATLVAEYRLAYDNGAMAGRSRLRSVTECGPGGACLPALSVEWQGGVAAWGGGPELPGFSPAQGYVDNDLYPTVTGDWNGDGKTDIGRVTPSGVEFHVSAGGGWSPYPGLAVLGRNQGYADNNVYPILTGDWNGDGRTDIARVWCCGILFFVSTGNGWAEYSSAGVGNIGPELGYTNASTHPILTGDWNGDGRTDIARVWCCGIVFFVSTGSGWAEYPSGGTGNIGPEQGYTNASTHPILTGDWNGDGRTDIARVWCCGIVFFISTGSGWAEYSSGGIGNIGPSQGYVDANVHPIFTGDWNGDGLTDLARVWCCGVSFYLNTGSGWTFYHDLAWYGPSQGYTNASEMPILTGDWNGDGKTDFARVWSSGITFLVSTGTGFSYFGDASGFAPSQGYLNVSQMPLLTGDWNGDGKTDFARVWCCGLTAQHQGWASSDLVTGLRREGHSLYAFQYKPLTDASVYEKGSGAVYPQLELQAPIQVVSAVSESDGAGGLRSRNYRYAGMRTSLDGRGPLGFHLVRATDTESGIVDWRYFQRDFPFTGLPYTSAVISPGGVYLQNVASTYGCTDFVSASGCQVAPGRRYFPFVSQQVQTGADLNGAALPSVSTSTTYDAFGNPTSIVVSTSDGYGKTLTNTYDTANWPPGRPTRSTVQSTSP
jgi:hypothetical protein